MTESARLKHRPRSQLLGASATAEKLPPALHSDFPLALVSHVCRVSTLPTADQFSLRKPSSASLNAGAVRTGAACRAPETTMSRDSHRDSGEAGGLNACRINREDSQH